MKPIHEAGEISPEGSQNVSDTMNVYGTYVHGVFDGEGRGDGGHCGVYHYIFYIGEENND